MYRGRVTMLVDNCDNNIVDDVIVSKNRSKFWTPVTSLILELECWSNAQNVGNSRGYLDSKSISGDTFDEKVRRDLKISSVYKISKYATWLQFDII